jgi:hypothetical protein
VIFLQLTGHFHVPDYYLYSTTERFLPKSRRGRRVVVGFTTTCAICANHDQSCEFESR